MYLAMDVSSDRELNKLAKATLLYASLIFKRFLANEKLNTIQHYKE